MRTEQVLDDAARAILDDTPVDWNDLAATASGDDRALLAELKVLSAVASVHRSDALLDRTEVPARRGWLDEPRTGLGTWGHLQLLERVGSGVFGDVYRAWDTRLAREVALKLLPAGDAADAGASPVVDEGRLMARVTHPNVATVYGADRFDDRVGLWMEFIEGQTLEALLQSGHAFSVADACDIGISLCRALSAVHEAGLLHRDVKTQNVMRAGNGRTVLTDFGTGLGPGDADAHPAGTPLYLAPEVLAGGPATVRSDVYAAGVVIYRLLTGGFPVTADTIAELRRAHADGARVGLGDVRPDLPDRLVGVVMRAIDPDPSRRPDSAKALEAELASAVAPPAWRRPAAALAVAALAVLVVWVGWPGERRDGAAGTTRAALGGLAAGVDSAGPAIAVLPFRNLRTDPNSDQLVDGLTYELIRNLAIIDGLDVRSATSSFALRGTTDDLPAIGRRLGVNLIVEASVQGSGDDWRVLAALVDVAANRPLFSRRFDRTSGDVLAMQDDIARAIANELRLTLGTGQRRYDLDADATRQYLQARALVEQRQTEPAEQAIALLSDLLARDPSFAPAEAARADAYASMSMSLPDVGGLAHTRALGLMRASAEAAIALDPLLSEGHAAMGYLHAREHAWDRAVASFERAIELNPTLTHVYTNYSLSTLVPLRRFEQAESLLLDAARRDPLSADVWLQLGMVQLTAGRYDEAIVTLRRAADLSHDLNFTPLILARALTLGGHLDEALPIWDSRSELGWQHWTALAYVRAGRREVVERYAVEHQDPYRLTLIHAALGNIEEAIDALDQAADRAPHRVVRLLWYPELAALRDHPRFAAIKAKFKLP